MVNNFHEKIDFIWSVADLLRGDYKQSEYHKVVLPLTVLRRLDCVIEPTKDEVREEYQRLQERGIENIDHVLKRQYNVYNTSEYTWDTLCSDPDHLRSNLIHYIESFNPDTKEIINKFDFQHQIERLDEADLLFHVVSRFNEIDLHPEKVPNEEMGYIYEELIRKFSELSNETAGEHFTPREVIRLMVNLIFNEDADTLTQSGVVRTLYDPACGTGGMLSVGEEYMRELNSDARLVTYGQELNPESYAICNSDMLIKGHNPENIAYGNSFTNDGFPGRTFDYMLSNPPFGVSWKKVKDEIEKEHEERGFDGRFGAGTPRVSDGALLFLQHMISKMKPVDQGGSRLAIVFNGSPLFTGGPNSGESAIRRWIIENDWLEAIVGLPENLFYNTGIHTYIWVLTNRKPEHRKGKIQLIDARDLFEEMDRSLGEKRHYLSDDHIAEIVRVFGDLEANGRSVILDNEDLGYRRIVIDRPLRMSFQATEERIESLDDERAFTNRDEETQTKVKEALSALDSEKVWMNRDEFIDEVDQCLEELGLNVRKSVYNAIERALGERDPEADIVTNSKGDPESDSDLRERERVPLDEDPYEYFEREVKPHVSNAWINEDSRYFDEQDKELGVVGYEINFNRYFYEYEPPRPLEEIDADIQRITGEASKLLEQMIE